MANNEGGRVSIKLPTKPGSAPRRYIKERAEHIKQILCNSHELQVVILAKLCKQPNRQTVHPLFSDWLMHQLIFVLIGWRHLQLHQLTEKCSQIGFVLVWLNISFIYLLGQSQVHHNRGWTGSGEVRKNPAREIEATSPTTLSQSWDWPVIGKRLGVLKQSQGRGGSVVAKCD